MTKKSILLLGLTGVLGAVGVIGTSQLNKAFKLGAAEVNTWKHFAAIMPTETEKGIREYWTDCVGGAPRFTAPEGITATDATLTDEQKAYILNHAGDERVIPTLSQIKRSVAKGYDGKASAQGYDVEMAYNYVYLDEATKTEVSGANETNIIGAYQTYNARFAQIDSPLISGPQYPFVDPSFKETYVDGYGLVNEMVSGTVSEGGWLSFKYEDATFDLSNCESVSFYLYNPTDSAWAKVWVENDSWSEGSQLTFTIPSHSWGEIKIDKSWFDSNASSQFKSWWLGVVDYRGYESATETLKITRPVAKTLTGAAAEFDDVVGKISSTTNPTRGDSYYIVKAGSILAGLSDGAKVLATKLADYNSAKANCSYTIAGLIDASSFAITDGWGAAGTASNVSDADYGEVLKITVTQTGGAMESSFAGITVDSSSYDTVSFYVKADWEAKFTFSKNDWWKGAYDFATGQWVETGDGVTFKTGANAAWTLCTMSSEDFNQCKYYSFFNNSAVGQSFYMSPIYLSNSAQ